MQYEINKLRKLLKWNRGWVETTLTEDQNFFAKLAKEQKPSIL